jgi:hypothetical protein
MYDESLKYIFQRHNANPKFTDIEVMTNFLYVAGEEHLVRIKHIYGFAKNRLISWFPQLPLINAKKPSMICFLAPYLLSSSQLNRYNRLNGKTNLQQASNVRSTAGLLVHVFAMIAADFIYLIFQPLIHMNN